MVSVCFGLLRNRSVCFGCFDMGSKHRNKLKFFLFGFTKQTEKNAKQILFRFVSVRTENYFCLFRGHPICVSSTVSYITGETVHNVLCDDSNGYELSVTNTVAPRALNCTVNNSIINI